MMLQKVGQDDRVEASSMWLCNKKSHSNKDETRLYSKEKKKGKTLGITKEVKGQLKSGGAERWCREKQETVHSSNFSSLEGKEGEGKS
jgi:hypothetical protein